MKSDFVPLDFVLTPKNLTTRIPVFVILNNSDNLNSEKKSKTANKMKIPIVGNNFCKNTYLPMCMTEI